MSISEELARLDELRRNGSLSHAEFELAKKKVLTQEHGAASSNLDEIREQNQIAQLDREWALERESYMVRGKYGRHLPSRGTSVLAGVAIIGFGIVWIAMTSSTVGHLAGPASFFPLFGVLFVVLGVGMSIFSFNKAGAYSEAEARYRERREALVRQQARR